MQLDPSTWRGIRLAIVATSFVSVFYHTMPSSNHIDWMSIAIALSCFPCMALVGVGVLLVTKGKQFSWQPPSWGVNPFNLKHPEQFFHMVAWVIMVQSVAILLKSTASTGSPSPAALIPLAFGVGCWFGLWLLTRIYLWQAPPSV